MLCNVCILECRIENKIGLKSLLFRMMGFGEEEGVIPRFCNELFSGLASMEHEEVKSLRVYSLLNTFIFCSFSPFLASTFIENGIRLQFLIKTSQCLKDLK